MLQFLSSGEHDELLAKYAQKTNDIARNVRGLLKAKSYNELIEKLLLLQLSENLFGVDKGKVSKFTEKDKPQWTLVAMSISRNSASKGLIWVSLSFTCEQPRYRPLEMLGWFPWIWLLVEVYCYRDSGRY